MGTGYVSQRIAAKTRAKPDSPRNILRQMARAELAAMAPPAPRVSPRAGLGLVDYVHALSPYLEAPRHLQPVADLFARMQAGESVRACVSVPVRGGKTTIIQHGVCQTLELHPDWPVVYASYAAVIAEEKSKGIRDLAHEAGLHLRDDTAAAGRWRLTDGGGLLATGVGGPLTGYDARVIVVDDAHKGRAEVDSLTEREKVHAWLRSAAVSRMEPGGSIIVVNARWHPDDLIGRLVAEGWEYVNIPAINADGESYWPEQRPIDYLRTQERELGPREWAGLMMGDPRPRGGKVFEAQATVYKDSPTELAKAIGLDLAYSAKTSADWSVAVVMGRQGRGPDAKFYVLDVVRRQTTAPEFADELGKLKTKHPLTRTRIYAGGTERGTLDFLARPAPAGVGLAVDVRPALGDKFARATPVAAAWNRGDILVREGAAWAECFCDEVARFTGQNDPHDDQVDALAAAFDVLAENSTSEIATAGRRSTADLRDTYGGARPSARGWNTR